MFKVLLAGLVMAGLVAAAEAAPVRVGGSEQQKLLVKKVVPVYPAEAKAKGLTGTVRLEAILNRDGSVKELKVISGEEVFVNAAMPAVKQWVYKPTLVDGEPAEVITQIDVNFKLSK